MTNEVEVIESDIDAQIALRVMRGRTFIASTFAATATLVGVLSFGNLGECRGSTRQGPAPTFVSVAPSHQLNRATVMHGNLAL